MSGQYYQNGFVRPEQTAIAGITGGLLTSVGMSTGLLGNVSLGTINNVANTTFQDVYYNAGNPNGSSLLWSAAVSGGFSIAGFKFGSFVASAIQGVSPVFKPGVSAILQKPNNTSFVYGNIFGGVMQNAGTGVEGKSNKSIP
ncbi:MAG: hypothetical protein JO080_11820 [Mucilaginibacter sp.]|nr:hypothetical protein [Mucilaginibacter sp.]